jgi:hypothetical protein
MLFDGAKVKNITFAPWGDQRVFTVQEFTLAIWKCH